jgi:hypothetical protein
VIGVSEHGNESVDYVKAGHFVTIKCAKMIMHEDFRWFVGTTRDITRNSTLFPQTRARVE